MSPVRGEFRAVELPESLSISLAQVRPAICALHSSKAHEQCMVSAPLPNGVHRNMSLLPGQTSDAPPLTHSAFAPLSTFVKAHRKYLSVSFLPLPYPSVASLFPSQGPGDVPLLGTNPFTC